MVHPRSADINQPQRRSILPSMAIEETSSTDENVAGSADIDGSDGNQSEQSEESGIYSNPTLIMENWEVLTKNILLKMFFSLEESNDVCMFDLIHHEIIFRQQKKTDLFVKLIIDAGIIDICELILRKASLEELIDSQKFDTICCLLRTIWNCCDGTREMGSAVIAGKLHKSIIESIEKPFFDIENIQKAPKCDKILNIVRPMLSVIYNAFRHNTESKQNFRDEHVIEVLLKYLKASEPELKTLALFSICFTADISAENNQLITATSSNIKFIIGSLLEPAMKSPKHRSGGNDGFSLQEILEGLSLLSQNAENASQMISQNMLVVCEDILEAAWNLEVKPCLDIIWSMTFHDDLRNRIKTSHRLLSFIEKFSSSGASNEGNEVSESARGIKWNLERFDQPAVIAKETAENYIMISYCWAQKGLARQIKEKLDSAGKKVWIDTKNMQGDVYDSIAKAVENASHVICCISEDYAGSKFCKAEAKYSCLLEKK